MGRESNKKRRVSNAATAREKAAAARVDQQRAEQRRRARMILSGAVVIAIVAVVIVVVALHKSPKSSPAGDRTTAQSAVIKDVTTVSDAALTKVGVGKVLTLPTPVTGEPPLTSGGKPELLYIGAEFCPYCAVERWSLAIALSKFGTLSNVGEVRSATDDGNFASLDFRGSSYTSKYLTFTPIENEDRNGKALESVTSAQKALWTKLDNGSPGFPFISFGNKLAFTTTAPLDPTVLGTLNQAQIAAQLNDPTSKIAQTVNGGANVDIAAICEMTGNQPSTVCNTSLVKTLQSKFTTASSG
jgi:Domain of unknown function (DUF929)